MKVVLLAGGNGTRLSEETELRPKPMVEIGAKNILPIITDIILTSKSIFATTQSVILKTMPNLGK
jgi:NDP-sugar pyrophosphorylase family protein